MQVQVSMLRSCRSQLTNHTSRMTAEDWNKVHWSQVYIEAYTYLESVLEPAKTASNDAASG